MTTSTTTSWSFRHIETGEVVDRVYTGPLSGLALNTPAGCEPLIGVWPAAGAPSREELLALRDAMEPPDD